MCATWAKRVSERLWHTAGACLPQPCPLEMDVVVVVEPAELWGDDEAAAPSLYVTLTRATQAVVVLHRLPLPVCALPLGQPGSPVRVTT